MKRKGFLFVLVISVFILANCTNPIPVLTTIDPAAKVCHLPTFVLTVTGTNFMNESKIVFNGVGKTTTYVSTTELTCEINPEDIATGPMTIPILVRNPSPGGGDSNSMDFTINGNYNFVTPKQISTSGKSGWSDLAVEAPGFIHVVWQRGDWNGEFFGEAYHSRSDDYGENWSSSFDFYNGSQSAAWKPRIVVDASGNLNVAGDCGTATRTWAHAYFIRSTSGGSSWNPAMEFGPDPFGWDADIAVDDSENINMVFSRGDIVFRRSTDEGGSWNPETIISWTDSIYPNPSNPRIAVGISGNIYVAWLATNSTKSQVRFRSSSNDGSTWSSLYGFGIADGGGLPELDTGSEGFIGLVWAQNYSGVYGIWLKYSTDGGANWNNPALNVTETDTYLCCPRICVDKANNINVSYYSSGIGLEFTRSTDLGVTWTTPVTVDVNAINNGSIDLDSDGNLYVVYSRNGNIFFSRSDF